MRAFTVEPRGPFDLATARAFAGGFAAGIGSCAAGDDSILTTFPVEGWAASAAVSSPGRLLHPARRRERPSTPNDRQGSRERRGPDAVRTTERGSIDRLTPTR